jgi:hypothetical protein
MPVSAVRERLFMKCLLVLSLLAAAVLAPAAAAKTSTAATATRLTPGPHRITMTRYANAYCESADNPRAVNASGYYGKWQFDLTTWRRFAPSAWRSTRPDLAPERVQDRAALSVTYDAWPNC